MPRHDEQRSPASADGPSAPSSAAVSVRGAPATFDRSRSGRPGRSEADLVSACSAVALVGDEARHEDVAPVGDPDAGRGRGGCRAAGRGRRGTTSSTNSSTPPVRSEPDVAERRDRLEVAEQQHADDRAGDRAEAADHRGREHGDASRSAGSCRGSALCEQHARAARRRRRRSTPASRKPASFTLVVGTAAASAARSLSRVAIITRPARALRTPPATRIDSPRNARQSRYML